MYRIRLAPVAQQVLLTLSDPVRREVGRQLALTAEDSSELAGGQGSAREVRRLELGGLSLTCAFDAVQHTLTVRRIAHA